MTRGIILGAALALLAAPAHAQFGGLDKLKKGAEIAKKADDIHFSDAEEQELGQSVSDKVRAKFGVVQDKAVHRYVALVGTLLTNASAKPRLPWTFIVLDTDAVNAFAAPGGYVHITKGALAMMSSEAELAGVLGHEIIHVTERHTIAALQKAGGIGLATTASGKGESRITAAAVQKMTDAVLFGFGRGEELEADEKGERLANKAGYDPAALPGFLTKLTDRNKGSNEKRGLFASHPDMEARLSKLRAQIKREKLASTATLEPRYKQFIAFKPVPQSQIATADAGTKGLAGGSSKPASTSEKKSEKAEEEPKKKKGFGLGGLAKGLGGGSEQKQSQVVASGGARGLDPEVDAKGGGNPALVAVKVTTAEIDAFRKEGKLT
jgi:predicted Zn-dependent protease